ncbi:MAG: DUF4123 domain-containing protein [Gammaproteobacteria bacterium]|nr:DUF4123 domain-containing protein [Gammaproteobacteria bacterium]
MHFDKQRNAINEQLFSDQALQAYAVVDGASASGLVQKLNNWGTDYACLFSGELAPELRETAPYLLKLAPYAHATEWLLNNWGGHVGILAVIPKEIDFKAVRKHFRGFLIVISPDKERLYFRYYDPRVLRLYLPTCTLEEIQKVFGPVKHYLLEGKENDVQLYWPSSIGVEHNALVPEDNSSDSPDTRQEAPSRLPTVRTNRPMNSKGVADVLKLQPVQMTLGIVEEAGFVHWYVNTYMPKHLASFHETLREQDLHQMVAHGRNEALACGFTDPKSQVHFVTLMWEIGPNFHHYPGFREVAQLIHLIEPERIERFYALPDEQWATAKQGVDERYWFAEYREMG